MSTLPLKPDTILNNRYRILQIIGYGGFGNTYRVEDRILAAHCIVKELALDQICSRDTTNMTLLVADGYERVMQKWTNKFIGEAKNLAKIKNEGVVTVSDIWQEKGTVFYAMDYIKGDELPDSKNPDWKPMSWPEAKEIAIALLKALKEVHEVGLLHGDIKPANILLRKKTGMPVLIDFGTARSLEDDQNKTSTTMAYTPGYAPPELQNRKLSSDTNPSSDLYSWAMVVIGLFTKHLDEGSPIDAKTRVMLDRANADEYNEKSLRKWLPPSFPTQIIPILANCLILNPNLRPQSANAVLEQLKNINSEPLKSKTSRLSYKLKYQKSTLIIALLLIGLIPGLFFFFTYLEQHPSNEKMCLKIIKLVELERPEDFEDSEDSEDSEDNMYYCLEDIIPSIELCEYEYHEIKTCIMRSDNLEKIEICFLRCE